ncbi:Nuclear RNA export factor 1 [Papilio machaon]|uniref:Nuclear RNA export factor 1 n=1 Tax=Papilio machaon TaxID=76193 RepID=A0A194RMN5_PAPMA|nr:Nuclear RNA export factor 1 [Papilio machaon]
MTQSVEGTYAPIWNLISNRNLWGRYRARKRQRLLEQGKGFVPGYGPLRNSQFWADVDIPGNKKVNNTKVIRQQIVKKESTCEVIDMNTSIQHEPDLTDDNSPSIPLAQTQAQGTLQTLKKPLLNIQGKTQEKLKFNQKQQEQPNNDQNKVNTVFLNELNSGSQIPVLMKQPLTNTNIGATTSNSPLKTIPTLTNQVKPKKIPNTPNASNNYQNMHNVVCPPTVDPDKYLTTNLEMLYHSIYAQEPIIPRSALPSGYMPNNPGLMTNIIPMQTNQQTFTQQQIYTDSNFPTNTSTYINNEVPVTVPSQPYSPSDLFTEDGEVNKAIEEGRESSSSPDICKVGQRRQSAFDRLGPLTQPKKPKLTINLSFNKEQAIREVVGEDESNKYIPVHMREDIINSSDEIVTTYLDHWPWKNHIVVRKSVGARVSKSAMIMEQEQMEEVYERGNIFIQLSVKGYPNTWSKEDVLDTLLENLKGKSFVPCFIEFTPTECKFLVIRSRPALIAIHKLGFTARKEDVILNITIYDIDLDIKTLNFQPKDGIQIPIKSDLPKIHKNYCDILAKELVDKFLQTYFPILDSPPQDRDLIGDMYDTNAILTVTYNPILLSKSVWRRNRALFLFNRQTGDMIGGCLSTAKKIVKLLKKLPNLQHDPTSFTVDVLTHTNTSTIITICGVLKITTDSLAEDEPMLAFSKTVLLYTSDNVEYKIRNDMVYWDLPSEEYLKQAFTKTAVS